MKAHVVIRDRNPLGHQMTWGGAFADGLKRHGWQVATGNAPRPADLLVLWGVRRRDWIKAQKRAGGEVVILERGYAGDRFQWTSVSFGGGLNGRARFHGPFHDGSRWETHFAHLMQPWRQRPDGPVVVMGQVPTDNAVRHIDFNRWARQTCDHFRRTGRQVVFRPHPKFGAGGRPLADVLAEASMVVTFNSNSGVDAVLAGVPTIAVDRGAMAWDVTGHDLDAEPPTPDRTAWAHALAWKQWRMDELASGACWEAVSQASEAVAA